MANATKIDVVMKRVWGHVWGPVPDRPDWDGGQCKVCGKKATNVEIATDKYNELCSGSNG